MSVVRGLAVICSDLPLWLGWAEFKSLIFPLLAVWPGMGLLPPLWHGTGKCISPPSYPCAGKTCGKHTWMSSHRAGCAHDWQQCLQLLDRACTKSTCWGEAGLSEGNSSLCWLLFVTLERASFLEFNVLVCQEQLLGYKCCGMNFSLKVSTEAWRIFCTRLGHSILIIC